MKVIGVLVVLSHLLVVKRWNFVMRKLSIEFCEQEVKNEDQSRWYKRMYDTIHKQKPHKGESCTGLLQVVLSSFVLFFRRVCYHKVQAEKR